MEKNLIHLHVHSHYSLLDGMGKIPNLLDRAKELGMTAMALTDHGVMYGAIEFYKEALKRGIKPIIGCEIYIAPRKMSDRNPGIDVKPYHLVLLAKNNVGYRNLIKLTTLAHLEGYYYKPRVDKETLKKYSKGLIALSACVFGGEVPRAFVNGDKEGVKKAAEFYTELFGKENFYLEIQDHPEIPEQAPTNEALMKLAKEMGLKTVITNDSHYVDKEDWQAHEVLLCLQTGKTLLDENRMTMKGGDYSLRDYQSMSKNYAAHPELFKNTYEIAEKCNVSFELGKILIPHYVVPKGETPKSYLHKLVKERTKKRYSVITSDIKDRLKYELEVIEKMGYESYFLIVQDFVNWAKEKGILVGPGRGSAAGSLISYILNITELDPLKYDLLFERFLNPDRISMPDIDMDFADDRRGEVIEYVTEKYGQDRVAQIITFGTMAARNAIRDTGRVMGMSYADVDKIAKVTPAKLTLAESVHEVPEIKSIYQNNDEAKKLIDLAMRIEGVSRHASTHAAGVVISKEPLTEYTPLQKATKGELSTITQYSMTPLEDLGLLKMDFLGLSNLTILKNTLRIVRKLYGIQIDLSKLNMEDKKTFELLARADTTGVFQLESAGMKRYIRKLKPTVLEDIIAMVALYRPGPMQFIDDFIDRKHGKKKITYTHPLMENALKNTYGVIVYQEQVMQVAKDMANFTGGEADTLRKAMGKKIADLMKKMRMQFIKGSKKNGVDKKIAEKIFDDFENFAQYAFNKSHAACYAIIAYWTAYLKAHYPACFMAALLTSDYSNIDRIAIEIEECRKMGIEVLPPSVNESFLEFGVRKETGKIRFGLLGVKNVGIGIINAIIEAREEGGSFSSIEDFCKRVNAKEINKKVMESLIKSGAMDDLGDRGVLLYNLEKILNFAHKAQQNAGSGQIDLFGDSGIALPSLALTEPVMQINSKDRLAWEKELLGVYISEHPLDRYSGIYEKSVVDTIGSIDNAHVSREVKLACIITNVQRILTRNKETMAFARVEDKTGACEILAFPKILNNYSQYFEEGKIVLVYGKVNTKDQDVKIIVEKIKNLELVYSKDFLKPNSEIIIFHNETLNIYVPKDTKKEQLSKVKEILVKTEGPSKVMIHLDINGSAKKVQLPQGVIYSDDLKSQIMSVLS